MSSFHLAQLNIAQLSAPIDSPQLADFVNNLDRINTLADDAPGFVWRLQTEEGDATSIDYFGPEVITNMSVWENVDALHDYVYRTAHIEVLRRKKEWFEKMRGSHMVLWWIPAGHRPTLPQADARLRYLRKYGSSPDAFTFKQAYPAPDAQNMPATQSFDEACPAP
ncbi:DUF3291 domain-containing protein [Marinobacter fonticola]|uniref:DUF3291 domain-containing protein n=1 Tax=Marinobacter fonticola TaxID=2603215 RepID=UPI0011E6F209|nr:DUF3291 domain-containing protein [Marinobacter fonticola]